MPGNKSRGVATDPDDARFLERVMRYLEDELSEQGVALFREELAADARKREIFAHICISDTLVHEELPGMVAANPIIDEHPEPADRSAGDSLHDAMVLPAITRELDEPTGSDAITLDVHPVAGTAKTGRPWIKYGSWAAVVLVGMSVLLLRPSSPKAVIAATLASTVGAEWNDASAGPSSDGRVAVGQEINLKSGCAALRFSNATQLVAEGPARMKFTGPNSIQLFSGKISVKMQSGQSGFVVVTPDCKVTDLGTEFGVNTDAVARTTDVHVFSGRVQVAVEGSAALPQTVTIGGLAHVASGVVAVKADSSLQQLFVQDIAKSTTSLELADLLSGGNGTEEHRGGVLDPGTGAFGIWGTLDPWYDKAANLGTDDGSYHRTTALPAVDGCFIPARAATGAGVTQQVDSTGDRISCPACSGGNTMRLCVAGSVAPLPGGKTTPPKSGDINFSIAGHSYVMVCPNIGFTLDLAAIHHIHPVGQLSRFRCKFGSFGSANAGRADLLVLVDGAQRFSKTGFTALDGLVSVDIPLAPADRYLTIIITDGGIAGSENNLFLGDAYLDQAQKN